MAKTIYSLAIHPECIEGIQLVKRNERFSSKAEHSSAFLPISKGVTLEERIENFLETHKWSNHQISLIIPCEEVSFRVLHFPFQDKKKVKMALPFEIESEILTEREDSKYQYATQMLPDGTTRVLLLVIPTGYLQMLILLCARYDLLIKNIDCAAYKLFNSIPSPEENNPQFQVYLGVEETFINVIENQHLQAIKVFPNQLALYLQESPGIQQLDRHDLCQSILDAPKIPAPGRQNQSNPSPASLIQDEILTLCTQFNLFARTWNFRESPHVSYHGLFGILLEWDGASFKLRNGVSAHNANLAYENSPPNTLVQNPGEGTPLHSQEIKSFLSGFKPHWGILGELKKYGLRHLEGHDLSFYSEGTPMIRFLRKHRLKLVICVVFFMLMVGSSGANYFLELSYWENEIARTESQLNNILHHLLPDDSSLDIQAATTLLQTRVSQKKKLQKETRFNHRKYHILSFIKKISAALPDDESFNIKSMELNNSRFKVTGNAGSYEDLEIFTNRLSAFEEFKNKTLLPDYRKSQDKIFYTITLNHQP